MSAYKPLDTKREEFRKYLDRAGVMDALTKVLVGLYEEPEKPDDALGYVRQHLGGVSVEEYEVATARIAELEAELASYRAAPAPEG